jgi:hypothetical protein
MFTINKINILVKWRAHVAQNAHFRRLLADTLLCEINIDALQVLCRVLTGVKTWLKQSILQNWMPASFYILNLKGTP